MRKVCFALTAALFAGSGSGMASPVPMELPAWFAPAQDDYDASVVLPDVDEPNWDFGNYYVRAESDYLDVFRCYYNYNSSQDDWLILPQLKTEAGGLFRISLSAYTTAKVSYSILWGSEPTLEAMTNVIWQGESGYTVEMTPIEEDFTVPAGENIYVGFHVTTELGVGYLDICDITVSQASTAFPAAPELSVTMDGLTGTATVLLPSKTVGGDDIPSSEVKAVIVVDGMEKYTYTIGGVPGDEVTAELSLPAGEHTAVCTASYVADGQEWQSKPATASFTAFVPEDYTLELPLEFTPADENFALLKILNVNDDTREWTMNPVYPGEIRLENHFRNDADDWAILPAVNVTVPGKYKFTMMAGAHSANCPESVELCVGASPDPGAMTLTPIRLEDFTDVRGSDGRLPVFEGVAEIPAAGKYYLGIHGFSKADMLYVYVSTVTMEKIEEPLVDPDLYATLPADMFDIEIGMACTDGVRFKFTPVDKLMVYANILVDERYLTEDGLEDIDFACQIVNVSNQMLDMMGSFEAAMSAEFFYLGDTEGDGFGGMATGTRAFFAVMGLDYHEDSNTVTAATKVSRSEVFEFTDEHFPQEEPWADLVNPQYIEKGNAKVVRVEVVPNDAAGDYVYGKAFAPDHRDNNSDSEIIDWLTSTSNMMETWIYPNRIDAELEPGQQALIAVTTLYKSSGKKSDRLNWMLVEAPPQVGMPVKVLASATGTSSVGTINVMDENIPVEYYTIDGVKVDGGVLAPGLYLRRQGNVVTKVIVR